MVKIKLSWLIILVFSSYYCCANDTMHEGNLYLISGSPTTIETTRYATVLYQVNKTSGLKRIRTITTQQQGADFIVPYYDQKLIIIGNKSQDNYYQYDLLYMNFPELEKSVEVQLCSGCSFRRSYLLEKQHKLYFLIKTLKLIAQDKVDIQFLGFDIEKKQAIAIKQSDIEYALAFGASSGQYNHDHIQWLSSLHNRPMFYGTKENFLSWNLPPKLKLADKTLLEQAINNHEMRVITPHSSIIKTKQKGQLLIHYIQDKNTRKWQELALNNTTWVRGFGRWLVTEEQFLGFNRQAELVKLHQERQKKANTPNYNHWLERFHSWDIEKTGLLHVVNPLDNLHFKINTNEPDSEVLLVQNQQVIYRIADKIFASRINGQALTSPELLVQSDEVPAIHWAFISDARR